MWLEGLCGIWHDFLAEREIQRSCCMSYMGYRNPWIQCDSMGIIHPHGIIVVVAWAKFHHCNVYSHGYSSCPWIYIKNRVIASTTKSLFYYLLPPLLPPLLLLLLPTFPTTLTTTITTHIIAVTSHTVTLTSHPSPCYVTSLSLGLLIIIIVTKSQTTLSSRSH